MKNLLYIFVACFFSFAFVNCGKIKKTDAEIEREQWFAGFSDSVDYYKTRSQQIESNLEILNSNISNMIDEFELIKNPREVSGYYLLKGWSKKIPFTSTAIYARINESEILELIATLAGATFNQIEVNNGIDDCMSEVVPYDQAFNFRHDKFNSVYFSGGKADTIAEFIAAHAPEKINLVFFENSKKKPFVIPQDEKDMIAKTWDLYSAQKQAHVLQKELWLCSRKIETFRRMMDEENIRKSNHK